ncbi:ABC transporter permease [Saccharolobus islandicus]|uniref:ABC-type sulfate transport system, permease component n=1 Tax=Saccharolobus islandicus LAL14/1 TaxID=1241935 RepID=M9UDB6_SACIS|nr:ABC transporter permease [Sulfolobus islandicus]AGJ62521.1 ABC-type sulfate transport system, permease component [Sulfolobus islandicus LAL14/1]
MRVISLKFNTLQAISFFLSLLLALPTLYLLFYGYGPFFVKSVAFSSSLLSSIGLSFFASALSIVITVLIFTPLAYYLSRHRNPIIETLVDVPASIPHPLVGIALIFIDSPTNPLGALLYSHGIIFYYTYTGLLLALIIVSSPIYIRSMQNFFDSLPRSYEIYAMSLGASEFKVFTSVVFPLSIRGIISAGLTSIARAISEFGSVVIVAPYVTGWLFNNAYVASVYIYNEYETYFSASISASATLLLFSLILIVTSRIVNRFLYKT